MAKGDGSISQLGRNHWKVRVDFGTDPVTGKRHVVSRNVRGTKAEARKLRDQIRKEQESGIKADAGKTTLSEFIRTWADNKISSGVAAHETVQGYLSRLSHVEQYIGNVPINKIDAQTIENVYAVIRENEGLSGTSMNQIHTLLKGVLKKAVNYDLLMRNPCDRVTAPKKNDVDRRSLNAEECVRLASSLDDAERKHLAAMKAKEERMSKLDKTAGRISVRGIGKLGCIQAVRIALATGMRRGEIAGLEWGNVNLDLAVINVTQSRTKYNTNKAPKTKASIRTIHLDHDTVASLTEWKACQCELLATLGIEQCETTPVCCSDIGGYFDLSNFERFWRSFKKEHGFEGLRFHELRHTQATQLLANGMDVKTVQARMGHSNASVTLNWYAHAVDDNDKTAADMVGYLLSGKQESATEAA